MKDSYTQEEMKALVNEAYLRGQKDMAARIEAAWFQHTLALSADVLNGIAKYPQLIKTQDIQPLPDPEPKKPDLTLDNFVASTLDGFSTVKTVGGVGE